MSVQCLKVRVHFFLIRKQAPPQIPPPLRRAGKLGTLGIQLAHQGQFAVTKHTTLHTDGEHLHFVLIQFPVFKQIQRQAQYQAGKIQYVHFAKFRFNIRPIQPCVFFGIKQIHIGQKAHATAIGGIMLVHVGNGIEIIVAYIHNECVRVVRVSSCPLPQPVKPGTKVLLVKKQGAMELKSGIRRLVKVVGILAASGHLVPGLAHDPQQLFPPYRIIQNVVIRHLAHRGLGVIFPQQQPF